MEIYKMKIKVLPVILALITFFIGTVLLGIGAYGDSLVTFLIGVGFYALCILCCFIGLLTAKEVTQKIMNS